MSKLSDQAQVNTLSAAEALTQRGYLLQDEFGKVKMFDAQRGTHWERESSPSPALRRTIDHRRGVVEDRAASMAAALSKSPDQSVSKKTPAVKGPGLSR